MRVVSYDGASLEPGPLWARKENPLSYQPKPIDTSSVSLTPEILELRELLAENAHDHWARQRMAEGWSYGPERNDRRKESPCLVPYDRLPESEKQYDRSRDGRKGAPHK